MPCDGMVSELGEAELLYAARTLILIILANPLSVPRISGSLILKWSANWGSKSSSGSSDPGPDPFCFSCRECFGGLVLSSLFHRWTRGSHTPHRTLRPLFNTQILDFENFDQGLNFSCGVRNPWKERETHRELDSKDLDVGDFSTKAGRVAKSWLLSPRPK